MGAMHRISSSRTIAYDCTFQPLTPGKSKTLFVTTQSQSVSRSTKSTSLILPLCSEMPFYFSILRFWVFDLWLKSKTWYEFCHISVILDYYWLYFKDTNTLLKVCQYIALTQNICLRIQTIINFSFCEMHIFNKTLLCKNIHTQYNLLKVRYFFRKICNSRLNNSKMLRIRNPLTLDHLFLIEQKEIGIISNLLEEYF